MDHRQILSFKIKIRCQILDKLILPEIKVSLCITLKIQNNLLRECLLKITINAQKERKMMEENK